MKRLINRVLQEWSRHPGLPSLKREGLRERMANDIVNNMRKKSTGNGWFLDLSPDHMRNTTNPENR
jgi:hypothetical protein